ncbi:MAG TPA: T3SS effector HopA1 family protein, partial [Gemmatimonadota bacterium]|nr:T3SS effector HopA1 family protein [Gemmatimonadota bacterium]
MRPRSHSMGPRPLSAVPLAGPLRVFAQQVWAQRQNIRSANDVYRLYGAVSQQNQLTHGGASADTMYLDRLYSLGLVRGQPSVQGYESFEFGALLAARRDYLEGGTLIPPGQLLNQIQPEAAQYRITPENYLVIELAETFYHYVSSNRCPVKERVYLNVRANVATDIMKYVVTEFVDKMAGVDEAKIAGPQGVADRADTIVIYTSNKAASDQVVAQLREYQNQHGTGAFLSELPAMTARQLPGVSTGAEPASV